MRDTNLVELLLSLFTSPDRAAAIAGDLAEEDAKRGEQSSLRVFQTALALWRGALTDAPFAVIVLVVAGSTLLAGSAFGGLAAVYLFPWNWAPLSWLAMSCLWWGGALSTGASLVSIAPRRGMAACAVLALAGASLLLAFGVTALSLDMWDPDFVLFYAVGLAGAVPLLAGGAIARRRIVLAGTLALLLLVAAAPASAQQAAFKDPSPHTVRLVTVEDGVQLEVLDWGGSGMPLVLLTGAGDTAHVYDDIALTLRATHRVVGITRRGHRGSSPATSGYGFQRLADDVIRVMDEMRIETAVVTGHSFAGEEMHVLGARHADRIKGLVYIDAAFNRGDSADNAAFGAVAKLVPAAPSPKPADFASVAALQAYLVKYVGGAGPEARLRTRYIVSADGTITGMWVPDVAIRQAMSKELQAAYASYNPERIRVPAVAIYAMPKSADDFMRHGSSDRLAFPELVAEAAADPVVRGHVEKLYQLTRTRVSAHEKWFETFSGGGRIVELSGTHDLIVGNPREVLEQIEAFAASTR